MTETKESVRRDAAARQIEQKENVDWRGKDFKQLLYAELHEHSAGTNITLTDLGVFYQWVSSDVGQCSGVDYLVASTASDNITVGVSGAGVYMVSISASFRGSNNSNIHGSVFVNAVQQTNLEFHRKMGGADIGSGSVQGLVTLVAGDVADFRFSSDTDNTTVTIEHAHLLLVRISA